MVSTKVRELGWFFFLWVGGVLSLTVVGLIIKMFIAA